MADDYIDYFVALLLKEVKEKNCLFKILSVIQKSNEVAKLDIVNLYSEGCLKELIVSLQCSQNLDSLSLTLGIIGMCCTQSICTEEMITKYNLLLHLNHLLDKYKQDEIQRKVFRIIKNICQRHHKNYFGHCHLDFANEVIEREADLHMIAKIVTYLKTVATMEDEPHESETISSPISKSTETTIIIALRVLRELANSKLVIPLIKECEIMKALGMLIIKLSPLWQNTKRCERILRDTLNIMVKLLEYSKTKDYEGCDMILELKNTDKGNALVHLAKLLPLTPLAVVKITVSLSELNSQKSNLPFDDVFESLIEELENPARFARGREAFKHKDYLEYLCLLIRHPDVAMQENFNTRIVPLFHRILRDYTYPTEIALKNCSLIISTLRMEYDASSLLEHGIIDVLSKTSDLILGPGLDIDTTHNCTNTNDRYCNLHKRVKLSWRLLNPPVVHSAPRGIVPVQQASNLLNSTRARSSRRKRITYSDVGDEIILEEETGKYIYVSSELKKQLSNEIIKFIKPLVAKPLVVLKIISTNFLTKLLKFFVPANKSYCSGSTIKVVLLIVQNPEYRFEIMQTDFLAAAFKFRLSQMKCSTCLTTSRIGQYILWSFREYLRLSGKSLQYYVNQLDLCMKNKIVSVIAYLASDKSTFNYHMITCGGLNILMQALTDSQSSYYVQLRCINALCTIATRLKFGKSKPYLNGNYSTENIDVHFKFPIDIHQNKAQKKYSNPVRFKLDDGTYFEEDRNFLSQKSDYFNSLLCGKFKESNQEEIHLQNVSSNSLKFLMMFLRCNITKKLPILAMKDVELDVLLDVINLANIYLLGELRDYVVKCVKYFKFSSANVPVIYRWSLESKTDIFRTDIIKFALSLRAKMDDAERLAMFRNFLWKEYSECFLIDMHKLFADNLL